MKEYGIIGYPLTHSHSPTYFSNKFEKEKIKQTYYHSFPITNIIELHHLIKHYPFLYGLNVTSPYKLEIVPHLHQIHEVAMAIGAVNVIDIKHEGDTTELIGYNTDATAFNQAISEKWGDISGQALIFGTGGAAHAAAYALKQKQIHYNFVSRSSSAENILCYDKLTPAILDEFKLLINATPVGLFPNTSELLSLPYDSIGSTHYLMDMIYYPKETQFLREGAKRGAKIQNGERMFLIQAEMSWQIWKGETVKFST